MDDFATIASNPLAWVKKWKDSHHKKVIGCLPMYTPEEIIAAADVLPVAIPGRDAPIILANAYLHNNLCHPARGNFELALSGELKFMDGLVFPDICDQTKRLANVWRLYYRTGFFYSLWLPKRLDTPSAKAFYTEVLGNFCAALEKFAGHKITDEDIKRSIKTYNEVRRLLARLYELRRNSPASFQASEIDYIVTSAMVMPKSEFKDKLAQYLENKKTAPVNHAKKPRLLVVGNPCEDMEPKLLDMVAEIDGIIVDDYVYSGSMYLSQPVAETGNPLEALAQAYLDSRPCPTKHNPSKSWGEYIVSLAKRAAAAGVIMLFPKYCEIFGFDYPEAKEKLSAAGIPHLMLEVEHSGADGRLKTRLEAFMEMLRV